jgi:hypothetical protein
MPAIAQKRRGHKSFIYSRLHLHPNPRNSFSTTCPRTCGERFTTIVQNRTHLPLTPLPGFDSIRLVSR